jgi:hypothetical protein
MRKAVVLGVALIAFSLLCSCGTRHHISSVSNARHIQNIESYTLNIAGPVALRNASTSKSGDLELLCALGGHDIMGNHFDVSESAVGTVRYFMQKKNVPLDDKADKRLELSVFKIICGPMHGVTTKVMVTTGSGLTREYSANVKLNVSVLQATRGIELAFTKCLEQMLRDKDIIDYLEKK